MESPLIVTSDTADPPVLARLAAQGVVVRAVASGETQIEEGGLQVVQAVIEGPRGDLAVRQAAVVAPQAHALGDGEDLKGASVLLCSDASRHITGQILGIDGGASIA